MNKKLLSIFLSGVMLLTPVVSLAAVVADNPAGKTVALIAEGDTMNGNYGFVQENRGAIDENLEYVILNAGLITENRGIVVDNYGNIKKNSGTVRIHHSGIAVIEENTGVVKDNQGYVNKNSGTVTNGAPVGVFVPYVTENLESGVVNGGKVSRNYGGTINGATVETQYYKIKVPENIEIVGPYVESNVDENIWIPSGKPVEIFVLPEDGYVISSDVQVSGGGVSKGDGWFEFSNVTEDIEVIASAIKAVDYKIITGDKQTYKGNGNMSFTVSGMKEKLKKIEVRSLAAEDGEVTVLTPDVDYSKENVDSSGYFTLNESYLKTLKNGNYIIYFIYNDGYVEGNFTVAEPKPESKDDKITSPKTGDIGIVKVISNFAQML